MGGRCQPTTVIHCALSSRICMATRARSTSTGLNSRARRWWATGSNVAGRWMAGSSDASPPDRSEDEMILRFQAASRLVHWAHALPFLFLLFSGLVLFLPTVKAVHIGGYRLVPLLHVIVGIAFIL